MNLARERLEASKLCFHKGLFNSSISELYFALFTLLRAYLGEPPEGRWKHIKISRVFAKTAMEKGRFAPDFLREVIELSDALYEFRRRIDYINSIRELEREEVMNYLSKVEEVFKVVAA